MAPVTVSATSPDLVLANGVQLLRGEPFDGVIEATYPGGTLKSRASYARGELHGIATTFYPDGRLRDARSYRANLSHGRHVGYWDNGQRQVRLHIPRREARGAAATVVPQRRRPTPR